MEEVYTLFPDDPAYIPVCSGGIDGIKKEVLKTHVLIIFCISIYIMSRILKELRLIFENGVLAPRDLIIIMD